MKKDFSLSINLKNMVHTDPLVLSMNYDQPNNTNSSSVFQKAFFSLFPTLSLMLGDLQMNLPIETSQQICNGHAMLARNTVFHHEDSSKNAI